MCYALCMKQDWHKELQKIVAALNQPRVGADLRKLVRLWMESGPNMDRFAAAHPAIWEECRQHWAPTIWPTRGGAVSIELAERSIELRRPADEKALRERGAGFMRARTIGLFLNLIINHQWARLAGPCGWCGDYFIAERLRSRRQGAVYCTRKCAWHATAVASADRRREAEVKAKVERVKTAIRSCPRGVDWKEHVSSTTDIDKRFLTRHASELKVPR